MVPEMQLEPVRIIAAHDSSLGVNLSTAVQEAIRCGHFEQEVVTDQGAIRFGIRDGAGGHEFFAVDPASREEISLRFQAPRATASGVIIKLNEFRRLRPAPPILKPGRRPDESFAVGACRFGCADPNAPNSILQRPVLLHIRGDFGNLAVIPQLAPLEPAHALLVPLSGPGGFPHLDQLLDGHLVSDVLAMSSSAPDWLFVFNSMHAGATVRHLHLQTLRWPNELPIETARTKSEQGFTLIDDARFPGGGFLFDREDESLLSDAIERLQTRRVPLNLLAKGGRAFLFPRHPEHEITASFSYSGFASMEMAGVVYTSSREAFEAATEDRIHDALAATSWGNMNAIQLFGGVIQPNH
jgi:hypothetical protein